MQPLLVPLTSTFRTRTDSHIFNVFRNAPITLRILIMCESYPFLLCLCLYSTYVLTLHILSSGLILVLTCFLFYLHCYSRCGRLSSYSLSKGGCSLLVHIRPYSIFLFFYHRLLFILGESSETILLFVDSGGSEVGHVPLDV
jgi:hypothetical protein